MPEDDEEKDVGKCERAYDAAEVRPDERKDTI